MFLLAGHFYFWSPIMSKKNRYSWQKRPTATVPAPTPTSAETSTVSPAQLTANRENAQLSTGPRTSAGLAKSSLNALKSGLTGRTVLLPNEDVAEYEQHIACYYAEFSPIGQRESDLVQSIAEAAWRLKRIPLLEASIYAVGSIELAEEYAEYDADMRPSMIQLAVHLKYEKQIRNLQLQEARLVRRREKEIAELRQLQQTRADQATNGTARVSKMTSSPALHPVRPTAPFENGFEFSNNSVSTHVDSDRGPNHSQAA